MLQETQDVLGFARPSIYCFLNHTRTNKFRKMSYITSVIPVLLPSISSVNHCLPNAELQTAPFIMTTTQKMTQGVSCDSLLKRIPEAETGGARKVAVTFGQNGSSGLDLLNELTCSCWQH